MKNQEIEALVAVKVMGYEDTGWHHVAYQDEPVRQWKIRVRDTGPHPFVYQLFEPAVKISDSWKVVENLSRLQFNLGWMPGKRLWRAVFSAPGLGGDSWAATSEKPERAICLAALEAIGFEVPA